MWVCFDALSSDCVFLIYMWVVVLYFCIVDCDCYVESFQMSSNIMGLACVRVVMV